MESKEDTGIEAIDTELDTLESIPAKIIEGGQRMIQTGFKISIRDVCEFNKIKEGDIVTIYIKKTNIKKKKHD